MSNFDITEALNGTISRAELEVCLRACKAMPPVHLAVVQGQQASVKTKRLHPVARRYCGGRGTTLNSKRRLLRLESLEAEKSRELRLLKEKLVAASHVLNDYARDGGTMHGGTHEKVKSILSMMDSPHSPAAGLAKSAPRNFRNDITFEELETRLSDAGDSIGRY